MNEETIFAAALEKKTATERQAFLDEACAGNAELRSAVNGLLLADADAGSFMEHPPVGVEPTVVSEAAGRDTLNSGDWAASLRFLGPCDKPDRIGMLDQYEIIEIVGHGGMGAVMRAFDTKLSRVVAVKVMSPGLATSTTAVKRFLREATTAASIHHDHVVTIHAVNDSHIPPYLVMQFIEGQTLQQKIDREGALGLKHILRIGSQSAAGLAAAHKLGVIHRDVKPANILLENGVERVKITDFGLARAADDAQMTQTGIIAGTPQYMSPEQAKGEPIDARSDLFSLGSVLYTMCTGRPAFRADNSIAVLRRVCDDTPRPIHETNAEVPSWLEAIVNKLLAKDPHDRFRTAAEVAELLSQHLAHEQNPAIAPRPPEIVCRQPPTAAPDTKTPRRATRPALLAVAATILLLLGLSFSEAAGVTNLAATVIRIATGEGTLVIEADDPSVKIAINGEEVTIHGSGLEEVRLRPGSYKLAATKDGQPIALDQELVNISRGGKQIVRVSLEGLTKQQTTKPTQLLDLARDGAFVDPRGKSMVTRAEKHIEFSVPAGQAFNLTVGFPGFDGNNRDAPRVLQEVEGNFLIQTAIPTFETPSRDSQLAGYEASWQSAGIVIWIDETKFLRVERASAGEWKNGEHFVNIEWFAKGSPVPEKMPDVKVEQDAPVYFQVERRGHYIHVRGSNDGRGWFEYRTITDSNLPFRAFVGVSAVKTTKSAFTCSFDKIILRSGPPESPLSLAAPTVWQPPHNPDPSKILQEAQADAQAGKYELALAKHVWYHQHALEFQPSQTGVRLSFAMSSWGKLCGDYPPALDKLLAIRDEAIATVKEGRKVFESFHDLVAINRTIDQEDVTLEVFVFLDTNHPADAKRVFAIAEPSLIKAKDYELWGKYVRPYETLASLTRMRRLNKESALKMKTDGGKAFLDEHYDKSFTNKVTTLVALLVVNGRKDQAEQVVADAKKEWADAKFHAKLQDALKGNIPEPWPDSAPAIRVPRNATSATAPRAPAGSPDSASPGSFIQLFNGKDLTGWKTLPEQPGVWQVEEGILQGQGGLSHLFSENTYGDFHLRVEVNLLKGDGGIRFRTELGLSNVSKVTGLKYPAGYEGEIIDAKSDHAKGNTGSVRPMYPVTTDLVPLGEWFTFEIIAQGNHFITKVNGQVAADCDDSQSRFNRGHVALSCGGSGLDTIVRFRKVEIKELSSSNQ